MRSGTRRTEGPDPRQSRPQPPAHGRFAKVFLPGGTPAAFLLSFFLLGTCVPALAQRPALEAYSEALRASQQTGDHEAAVEMLWRIVREHGDDPVADDALFQIGKITEKRIGDFDQAEEAFGLLLERGPRSRNHARAEQRLDRLRRDRATGDEPLRLLNEIQARFSEMGEAEAMARLRELDSRWPDFVRRDDVLYMIAEAEFRRKNYDAALSGYEELVQSYPESDRVYYVLGKIGKTHIERRDFDAAMEAFERVAAYEEAIYGARRSWDDQVRQVALFRALRTLFLLSLVVSGLALAVWLAGTRWRDLNTGVLLRAAVPVGILSALFLLAITLSFRKPWIYTSTLLVAWAVLGATGFVSQLFVGTRPMGRPGRILAAAGALVGFTAIVYAVYYGTDMANLLYDSIHYSMRSGEW